MRIYYDTSAGTSTLFWDAVIFVALLAWCLFAGKAIERLRNRGKTPKKFLGQAISRPSADDYGSDLGNFASMIVSGKEDSSSAHVPPSRAIPRRHSAGRTTK
jgi:hypothetical protein